MATVSVLPLRHKENEDGIPLYIAIRDKGSRAMMSLGVRIKDKHWNDDRSKVRRSHSDFAQLNRFLSERRAEAESEVDRRRAEGGDRKAMQSGQKLMTETSDKQTAYWAQGRYASNDRGDALRA